jgi:hypothetical protein
MSYARTFFVAAVNKKGGKHLRSPPSVKEALG